MLSYIPVERNDADVNDGGCFVALPLVLVDVDDDVVVFCFFFVSVTLLPMSLLSVIGVGVKRFAIREDFRVLLLVLLQVDESAIVSFVDGTLLSSLGDKSSFI